MPNPFEACLRNVPTPTFLLKRNLSIHYANATAKRLVGECQNWQGTGLGLLPEWFEQLIRKPDGGSITDVVVKEGKHELRVSVIEGEEDEKMFMVVVMHSELVVDYRTLFNKMPMVCMRQTCRRLTADYRAIHRSRQFSQ
jgi:hypothetical protein